MCGIAGRASASGRVDPDIVARMRDALAHRGPDDSGLWVAEDGRVCFGHRRLAVIDLSPAAHQPMADAGNELRIVFNGEIYNYRELRRQLESRGHRFRSQSDTEVIVEAFAEWGPDCVNRLNGMFAFAVFDSRHDRVVLARDRTGEKPLFYRLDGRSLAFASELKGLLADPGMPRRMDADALVGFLTYGYVLGEGCILDGVRKLPPASLATYDLGAGGLDVERYWNLPEPTGEPGQAGAPRSPGAAPDHMADELEDLLSDSVRLRMLADVPVGILLSGGVDSSLITALAARHSTDAVRTFTVSFPGDSRFDESAHARLVSSTFGTKHTELVAEAGSPDLLPELAAQFDEPLADSSAIPTHLVARLIRTEATVALGGDGGDELFAGYRHYSALQRQDALRRVIPGRLMASPGRAAARLLPTGMRGRNFLLGVGATTAESLARRNPLFDGRSRLKLLDRRLREHARRRPAPEAQLMALCPAGRSPLQQATTVDFLSYLPDDLLVKIDRASMLTSLELRAPWLDHRLVEFAFGRVPDGLRATASERKVLPKRLAARLLPAEFDLTRKQGFSVPLRAWFRQGWADYAADVLRGAEPGLFDPETVAALLRARERGANSERLLGLTMFELWRRHYRVSLPP